MFIKGKKGFYTFAHSAHSPLFEEPDRTLKILREDVLARENKLADPYPVVVALRN